MKIALSVILAHLIVVGAMLYLKAPTPKAKPRQPVAVQTIVLQEPKPQPVAAKPTPTPPQPKPTPKPVAAKPEPKPTPKPVVKKETSPNRDKLAQLMQESLQSLDSKPVESTTHKPKQIQALASESIAFKAAYQDQLVAFLENALTLPERGAVKIALTLNREGHVQTVQIKECPSQRNRTYVESTLPSLLLPPLGTDFKNEKSHTFSITLTSS